MQVSPAAARAVQFTEIVACAEPSPDNVFDETIVVTARKIAADLRREREGTSRSGIPLTSKRDRM